MQAAAANMRGPTRDFGAINGRQQLDQDNFLREMLGAYGISVGGVSPRSTTADMNNAATGYLARMTALLERIANKSDLPEQRRPGGAGPRPSIN
jgi:hypothetical protein